MESLVTYRDACEQLRVSYSTLQRLVKAGELRAVTLGKRMRRIDRASLDAYMAKL